MNDLNHSHAETICSTKYMHEHKVHFKTINIWMTESRLNASKIYFAFKNKICLAVAINRVATHWAHNFESTLNQP